MNTVATLSLGAASATRVAVPSGTPTEVWANGVRHYEGREDSAVIQSGDRYELPAQRPGVAARIDLVPRFYGLLGKKVTVTDRTGKELEAHREWCGWHRVVVATDPDTGLTTTFDPRERTIEVTSPARTTSQETRSGWSRTRWTVEASQKVDAQGDSRFITNLQGEQEVVMVGMVREMPANTPWIVKDQRTFEETLLPRGGVPVTRLVEQDLHLGTRTDKATLASTLDSQNRLTLHRPDGTSQTYELFLAP
ncbi:MAG TPA: hypothetical protein VNO81_12860 [Candidatus Nitrosotenuis sp.]|jgi:hypothetical protein|nr:hypothetical protein [Candidatus Nitrosotenuis sp.]